MIISLILKNSYKYYNVFNINTLKVVKGTNVCVLVDGKVKHVLKIREEERPCVELSTSRMARSRA